MPTYVIRCSDGSKCYIDEKTGFGIATSNREGKAMRFYSLWDAWRYVMDCGDSELWKPVRLVSKFGVPRFRFEIYEMSDREITDELTYLGDKWDEALENDEGQPPPGEWMVERMGALEAERERRKEKKEALWGVRYSLPTYRGTDMHLTWYWTPFQGTEEEARAEAADFEENRFLTFTADRHYEARQLPKARKWSRRTIV